jgi:hypothetical protein
MSSLMENSRAVAMEMVMMWQWSFEIDKRMVVRWWLLWYVHLNYYADLCFYCANLNSGLIAEIFTRKNV